MDTELNYLFCEEAFIRALEGQSTPSALSLKTPKIPTHALWVMWSSQPLLKLASAYNLLRHNL